MLLSVKVVGSNQSTTEEKRREREGGEERNRREGGRERKGGRGRESGREEKGEGGGVLCWNLQLPRTTSLLATLLPLQPGQVPSSGSAQVRGGLLPLQLLLSAPRSGAFRKPALAWVPRLHNTVLRACSPTSDWEMGLRKLPEQADFTPPQLRGLSLSGSTEEGGGTHALWLLAVCP